MTCGPADSELWPAPVVDVRLVLPDHWWRIPLQPPQARERSVDRLVERQFAGVDNQPQLRADARKQLLAQAQNAVEVDGKLLALCLLEVQGVPVPASLVMHWIDMPADPEATLGDGGMLLGLQAELQPAAGDSPEPGFSLDLARVGAGPVLRRVYESTAELEAAEPVSSVVADYWLERPDGTGLVQLAFATPMVGLREALLELFDAIAAALRWVTESEHKRVTGPPGH